MGRSRSCNLIADRPHVSIQLVSPASGEISKDAIPLAPEYIVSIQLVSPASGECPRWCHGQGWGLVRVSIQLVSPASGESGVG